LRLRYRNILATTTKYVNLKFLQRDIFVGSIKSVSLNLCVFSIILLFGEPDFLISLYISVEFVSVSLFPYRNPLHLYTILLPLPYGYAAVFPRFEDRPGRKTAACFDMPRFSGGVQSAPLLSFGHTPSGTVLVYIKLLMVEMRISPATTRSSAAKPSAKLSE